MELKQALEVLDVQVIGDLEQLHDAYTSRVRAIKDTHDFEQQLKLLNVARDTMRAEIIAGKELVPVLSKEIAKLVEKQAQDTMLAEAKEEISGSLATIKQHHVSRLHSNRDMAGIMSLMAGVAFFAKDNLVPLLPESVPQDSINLAMVLTCALFGGVAFMFNRSASRLSLQLDEFKQSVLRYRAISRILKNVFSGQKAMRESEFLNGIKSELGSLARTGFVVGLKGEFIEDYVDFLLKGNFIIETEDGNGDLQYSVGDMSR